MIRAGKRLRIVLVVMASLLIVAGTSFALKKFGRGYEAGGRLAPDGYARYASYTGAVKPGPVGGCNSSGCSVASGNRPSSSCCSGSGAASSSSVENIRAEAINYYSQKYGDADVTCEVRDFGCHQEAEITKDGSVVKKLSISGGRITEI